ncbi:helix-hairpin-helix domain-containing protein [Lacticaseibacillus yichunensis]|uniref:Helix-hairpin-helix domain-containing protein n=1 Tax=Lacticaseibacillus yichunensis TaxID=2486015 RepID=A0ABW4CRM6_9LACO|nr:helix-hairpin-helix domain-containing protein [Lacticaseibacillus yichunensis]
METVKEWIRQFWFVPLAVVVLVGYFWWQQQNSGPPPVPIAEFSSSAESGSSSTSASAAASSSAATAPGFVELKGAVAHPGLYPIDGTTRWAAVVKAAGGLLKNADASAVNLAKVAVDQESLYIPKAGETPPPGSTAGTGSAIGNSASGAGPATGAVVDLNHATAEELQTLSGIGAKKAADIIAYREQNGGFQTTEDLKKVSGIGDKTFEKLAGSITVSP